VASLCEAPRQLVVERTSSEDVVDDQDPRRGHALGHREQRGHRAALYRDGRVLDANVGDRCADRYLGVTHGNLLGGVATIARDDGRPRSTDSEPLRPRRAAIADDLARSPSRIHETKAVLQMVRASRGEDGWSHG